LEEELINLEKLTTVIFDLDGTLRHSVPKGETVFLDFAASLGAPAAAENQSKARRWAHDYWADSECLLIDVKAYGKVSGEFWENYAWRQLQAMGVSKTQAKEWAPLVHNHMKENYDPEDVIPEDVFPTLQKLRESEFTVGLVTNRENPVDEYLNEVGLVNHLDFFFAAGDIGAWKPSPEIFYYALGLANAKPQEAVYVGDNYYADVVGASSANIQPILIDPEGVFPDAEVPVIHAIGELTDILPVKSDS
jgi:HAD superfamily hydrolase (TIGR01549 family)